MYKLIKNPFSNQTNSVKKTEGNVVTCIPFDPDNTDYQEYLKWLEEGNTPQEADE
jgi:hypothetical protein